MASTTFSGPVTATNGFRGAVIGDVLGNLAGNVVGTFSGTIIGSGTTTHSVVSAINSTATATPAQVMPGYITSTSAAATTITLPTGSALGAAVGAAKGTIIVLYVDNTQGASVVTVQGSTNAIPSALAVADPLSAGLFTMPAGASGVGSFRIIFSSPTAYVFTRVA